MDSGDACIIVDMTIVTCVFTGDWQGAVAAISQQSEAFVEPTVNDWHRLHRRVEIIMTNKENGDGGSEEKKKKSG
jgi:hypothetical protein